MKKMLKKFNKLISNIFLEEIKSNNDFNLTSENIKYKNLKLAIVPGSFKPPHRGHWEMVMTYLSMVDKVIIIISNISKDANSKRILSKVNLNLLGKLLEKIKNSNIFENQNIKDIVKNIEVNSEILTYQLVKEFLDKILNFENNNDQNINNEINKFLNKIEKSLFNSIRLTSNNTEITPEISKEIFEIYSKVYGQQNNIEIRISNGASPIYDTFKIINEECENCKIFLGVSKKGGDDSRWKNIESAIKNQTVEVISHPVNVETNLSATDIRNNISNLNKEWFPDKLSETNFNDIKKLLGN